MAVTTEAFRNNLTSGQVPRRESYTRGRQGTGNKV